MCERSKTAPARQSPGPSRVGHDTSTDYPSGDREGLRPFDWHAVYWISPDTLYDATTDVYYRVR